MRKHSHWPGKELLLLGLLGGAVPAVPAQPPSPAATPGKAPVGDRVDRGAQVMVSSGAADGSNATEVIREIDDPHSGERWLLLRNPAHPGGPGRLVLARQNRQDGSRASGSAPGQYLPVVRAGDRIVIEEHTAVADARLEAVALNPAAAGAPLNVRLTLGGKVVRATAVGPGQAVFAPEVQGKR